MVINIIGFDLVEKEGGAQRGGMVGSTGVNPVPLEYIERGSISSYSHSAYFSEGGGGSKQV